MHLRGASQRQWVMDLLETGERSGAVAVGFKTKLKDVDDHHDFTELLREQDFRIILMTRRNTLKLAISTLNARRLFEHRDNGTSSTGTLACPMRALNELNLWIASKCARARRLS